MKVPYRLNRLFLVICLLTNHGLFAQSEFSNWYFGTGTDGISFVNNIPQKLSNKRTGIGFEGMVVVNSTSGGNLLFYSDGETVVDKNHNIMFNGSGLTGHFSGANCVQACPVPGTCQQQFYLFTNSAWDNTAGRISYSIVDFTSNPLGQVINKNTLFWNGPSDQATTLVNKPGTKDYWLINNEFGTAKYEVWPITATGVGTPVTYQFSNTGASYQMNYSKLAGKLTVTGLGSKKVTQFDFNALTGVLSNEVQLAPAFTGAGATRFSPDGTKLYAGLIDASNPVPVLHQYDVATGIWTSMNTCCYGHDLKLGPDNKMYFMRSYNDPQPLSVIDFPNLSATGNACGYHTLTFTPAFNGEVRRFPEILVLPDPPQANTDIVSASTSAVTVPVLQNDLASLNQTFNLESIITAPNLGTATISGNQIIYTPSQSFCNRSDTMVYRIKDSDCGVDTAMLIVRFPACPLSTLTCDNWLSTPTIPSYAEVGEIDIPGTTVTIEAMFNRTTPYLPGGGDQTEGDIVSKHNTFTDVNYLLRPNHAYITTTNGFFATPDVCPIELNRTYHVALVYDGTTLKYYRDGFLLSQVPASGSLILNNWKTRIGWYEPGGFTTNFIGFTNEVRIWNVARTQTELRTYMNSSLPSPTTQPGLLAYYTFDNLANKQGNALYNGSLSGSASINATNTNCAFVIDSCNIVPVTQDSSIIINTYTPVISLDICKNFLTVEDASTFKVGDTVLMIQMKGAEIDSSNTAAFGSITQLNNAGNYEFNYVKSKAGNQIELLNALTRQYDLPNGFVQLIRVPYYKSLVVTDTLTCLPWDGRKGGVLAFLVKDTLELNNNIDVTGKGFKGGRVVNTGLNSTNCFTNNYFYPNSSILAAPKGESIANISSNISSGKGASASGGGGGLDHNSGGGGGGNATDGGLGGWQLQECGNFPFDNRGIGGKGIPYSNAQNKIFMGGGGGAGHCNNDFSAAGNSNFNGGNGGGIVIASTNFFQSNNYQVVAKGDSAYELNAAVDEAHDGMGGGGAGGTILLAVNQYLDPVRINNAGGKGGDMHAPLTGGHIGPGGGGAGGVTWFNQPSTPATATVTTNGGRNGYLLLDNNNPFGSTPGTNGISLFNLVLPIDVVPFKKNIDSVRINPNPIDCDSFTFNGLAYVNQFPISQWQWSFGDGGFANGQITSHAFADSGTYTIKLVVTDVNGCKDSTQTQVRVQVSSIDFTYDQSVCNPLSVQFNGYPNTGLSPIFIVGDGNTITGNINPLYNYAQPGNYFVQFVLNNNGCIDTLTKLIRIAVVDSNIIVTRDTSICPGSTLQLITIPSLDFCWSPTTYLNNAGLANPITSTPENITYHFTARVTGNNLISNGDFSNGNTGFTSDYTFVSNNTTEGEYFVGTNPQTWNGGVSPCPDHTSGSGNMMMVNGSPVINQTIWKQTVPVTPNTLYAFSTWIQSVSANNPANLQFAINGVAIGQPITAAVPTCNWTRFYTTWNAGNQSSAVISIINKNTQVQGNDFALDDIQFATLTYYTDSVRIRIDSPFVHAGNDTSVCTKTNLQLHATGSTGGSVSWNNGITLSDSTSLQPTLTVKDTTAYIISLVSAAGCLVSDTVLVNALPGPIISTSNDTTVCLRSPVPLSASGGLTYLWTPAGTLTGANTDHPNALAIDTTTYTVTVTGINGCADTASVQVNVKTLERFGVTPTVKTCVHIPGQLSATGEPVTCGFPAIW